MSFRLQSPDIRICSSVERGEAVIDWVLGHLDAANSDKSVEAALGKKFWDIVREEWSGFDRINHEFYAAMFRRFLPYWPGIGSRTRLPSSFQVWRGQNQNNQQIGLSWTTNKKVASGFGIGFRYSNPSPVLYSTKVNLKDVALVVDYRNEAEIVLFQIPKDFDTVAIGKDGIGRIMQDK